MCNLYPWSYVLGVTSETKAANLWVLATCLSRTPPPSQAVATTVLQADSKLPISINNPEIQNNIIFITTAVFGKFKR